MLGFKVVADPSTPLLAAFTAWQRVYAHLADVFRITRHGAPNWGPAEEAMRATVEKGET